MAKTHTTFQRQHAGSFREHRLIYDGETPGYNVQTSFNADALREGREAERMRNVAHYLDNAAQGHPELEAILRDPQKREMIMAMVQVDDGGKIRWLSSEMLANSPEWHELYMKAPDELRQLKGRATSDIGSFVDTVNDALAVMDRAKAGGLVTVNAAAESILRGRTFDRDAMSNYRMALVDLADVVVMETQRRTQAQALALLEARAVTARTGLSPEMVTRFDAVLAKIRPLFKNPASPLDPQTRDAVLTELQAGASIALNREDSSVLDAEVGRMDQKLAELDARKTTLLIGRFGASERFHDLLLAVTPKDFVESGIRIDGKFDKNLVGIKLKVLGKDPSDVQLTQMMQVAGLEGPGPVELREADLQTTAEAIVARRDIEATVKRILNNPELPWTVEGIKTGLRIFIPGVLKNGLTDVPDQYRSYALGIVRKVWNTDKTADYLKTTFGLEGLRSPSFADARLNINLPEGVKKTLVDNHWEDKISISALHKLAGIEELAKKPLDYKAIAAKLFAKLTTFEAGDRVVDEEDFKEVFTLLFLLPPGEVAGVPVVGGVLTPNVLFEAAKGSAGAFWTEITANADPLKNLVDKVGTKNTVKSGKDDDFKNAMEAKLTGKPLALASSFTTQLRASRLHDLPWDQKLKITVKEYGRVVGNGASALWGHLSTIPNIFYDPATNGQLADILREESQLRSYRDAIRSVQTGSTQDGSNFAGIVRRLKENQEKRDKAVEPLYATENPAMHKTQARLLLEGSKRRFAALEANTSWPRTEPHNTRQTAYFLTMTYGGAAGGEYIDDPRGYFGPDPATGKPKHEDQLAKVNEYLARLRGGSEVGRTDILRPMENKWGLRLHPVPWQMLGRSVDSFGVPVVHGPSNPDNWLLDPANAGAGLNAVLEPIDSPAKVAFINAYCLRQPAEYVDATGKVVRITFLEAEKEVANIVRRLADLRDNYRITGEMTRRGDNNVDPLNILRSGADTVKQMLTSGDRAEQGLAIALLAGTGWLIYKGWKRGGWSRNLLVGIPIFFGLDAVVKKMTGRGIVNRLNLEYMKPELRHSPANQFILRNSRKAEYGFLQEDAGKQAVNELVSIDDPMPVQEMIMWKRQGRGSPPPDPTGRIQRAAGRVARKMGNYTQDTTPPPDVLAKANDYLFMAFDALCVEVADRNGLGEPKSQKGAQKIWERYVTFNDPQMEGFSPELIHIAHTRQMHCLSVADVMMSETPTGATKDFLENDSYLEWLFRNTGKSLQWVKQRLQRGMAIGEVYAEAAGYHAENAYDYVVENAPEAVQQAWENYIKPFGTRLRHQVTAEARNTWRFVTGTLNEIGMRIERDGPRWAEDVLDAAVKTGKFTVRKGQDLYRELQKLPISRDFIDLVDRGIFALTGMTGSQLLLYDSAIIEDDRHVERLAYRKESFHKELKDTLSVAAEVPASPAFESMVDDWIIHAADTDKVVTAGLSFEGAVPAGDPAAKKAKQLENFDKLPPHTKMAVYEGVKRRAFSFLLAERAIKLQTAGQFTPPLHTDWNSDLLIAGAGRKQNTLANQIYASYGRSETLLFLGAETATLTTVERSLQVWINDFQSQFLRQAERVFGKDTPQYNGYAQFLNTLFMNAAVEISLNGVGRAQNQTGFNALSAVEQRKALELTIDQAHKMLEYMRRMRGSSANPEKIQGIDYTKFNSVEMPADVRLIGQDVRNKSAVAVLPSAVNDATRALLDNAVPELVKPTTDTKGPGQIEKFITHLQGVSVDKVRSIEDKLLSDYLNGNITDNSERLLTVARIRNASASPEAKNRTQHFLDRGVVQTLAQITGEAKSMSLAEIKANKEGKPAVWKDALMKLYVSTNPATDRVTDAVSFVQEFVLYYGRLKDNKAAYETYLADESRKLVGPGAPGAQFPTESTYQYAEQPGKVFFATHHDAASRRFSSYDADLSPNAFLTPFEQMRLDFLRTELAK
jgi:hypothetical protein